MRRFCLIISFSFIFSILSAPAQKPSKIPVKQCDALLARQLVEHQADFSKTLGETDQRINVLIKVADFLWTSDQETARRYFAEAFQVAQDRFKEKGLERNESKGLIIEKL